MKPSMVITSKCPHCGAQVVFNSGDEVAICKYCDSVIAIQEVAPEMINSTQPQTETQQQVSQPILREIVPELKYKANHELGGNAQGGHIWITKHELYFKPHKLNFGDLSKRYIRIQDICGYEKGPLTYLTIFTKKQTPNGVKRGSMELVVWKKQEIINELETRRKLYFEERGLPVPPLDNGKAPSDEVVESEDAVDATDMPSKKNKIWIYLVVGLFIIYLLIKCSE